MNEKSQFASRADFNNGRRSSEVSNTNVQSTINSLMRGSTGTDSQATAFYFRQAKMKNETFSTPDGHSFAAKFDSGTHYMNGNYLQNAR